MRSRNVWKYFPVERPFQRKKGAASTKPTARSRL
jgi:hypothetical protein